MTVGKETVCFSMFNLTTLVTKDRKFFIKNKDKNRMFIILHPSPLLQGLIKVKLHIDPHKFGMGTIDGVFINLKNTTKLGSNQFQDVASP